MNQKNKNLNVSAEWQKAQTALKEAQVLLAEELPEGAISRFYYAAFHAAKALLLTEGLEERSHKGVGRFFSLHFVKSGKVDPKFSRILSHSQQDREEADYLAEYVFTVQDAEIRQAEVLEFLAAVAALLKQAGY